MDVYKAINLSNKSLSRYENNATTPEPETVKALIQLYDVSADFIMGLSDEMGRATPLSGTSKSKPKIADVIASGDKQTLDAFRDLSHEARVKALDYMEMLKTLDEVKSRENTIDLGKKA